MHLLLMEEAFDDFLFSEGVLVLETAYTLDGKLNRAYYDEEELESLKLTEEQYLPWRLMKARIYSLIRGSRTPLSFRFSLLLPEAFAYELGAEKGDSCLLGIRFQEDALTIVTGLSRSTFTTDRSLDRAWDDDARELLKRLSIIFEEIS